MTPTKGRAAEFGGVLLVLVVGAGGVLLLSARTWQTVGRHGVSGRTLDAAPAALGLVALAGVVAVLVTAGIARRAVGVLIALAGAACLWRSVSAAGPVSPSRARELLASGQQVNVIGGAPPAVVTHPGWAVLSAVAAALVLLAGVAVAVRGARWAGMSARYQRAAPTAAHNAAGARQNADEPQSETDAEQARTRTHAALWTEIEHGRDPTVESAEHDPHDPH